MKFSRLNTRFAGPFQEARVLFSLLLVCVTASAVVFAEENTEPVAPPPPVSLDEIFPDLRDRALVCTIEARIVESGDEVAWQSADSKVTISGRPVSLKLAGDNVVLAIQFTPYIRFQNQSSPMGYLVVQGQIWVNKGDGGMHYQGVMQTIPVSMGEKIYFFPLGPRRDRGESSIEILFEVQPYSESAGNAPKIEE
ncbi:MAG: hypothetical protein LBL31_01480 [Spirochaetaceae bacterium]|jgi:hypothetical protein|nr:hypothetical protein [Spirochaetaceae bacterium]